MENVSYFTPPAIGYYGKRSIFHALDHLNTIKYDKTAQQERRACRVPSAGIILSAKNIFFSYFPVPNHSLKNTIKQPNGNGMHAVFLEREAFFQQNNKCLLYFPLPNHSLKNTHILWKT